MWWNILPILIFCVVRFCAVFANSEEISQPSVLIIGSSIPLLRSALILTDNGLPVTFQYATPEIENEISGFTTVVKGVSYRLPRCHPVFYQYSTAARNLAYRFGNSFMQENELYVRISYRNDIAISSNEFVLGLLISAAHHGCIKILDIFKSHKLISALRDYDYTEYRNLYSNISLAQFAEKFGAPPKVLSCLLKSALIDSGSQIDVINAADAIAIMHFYYFKGKNGLRSYHMNNPYSSKNGSKILVDQIIRRLKSMNTTFIANKSIEAFLVDPNSGRILGDINNPKVKYDYVILGDTLRNSRKILTTTQQYNTGAPKIFLPLEKILNSLNQYSEPPRKLSIKFWLSKAMKMNGKSILQINNSPFPFSLQSIRLINILSGYGNQGNILEIIVADLDQSSEINWKKIFTELFDILPELETSLIYHYRIDKIDTGVLMDTKYGANRLSTKSVIENGIPNLILAGDWIDADNNDAVDLEKSVEIGNQAAFTILRDYYKHSWEDEF